jgi:deoxyribodipyrimidine photo-lyase
MKYSIFWFRRDLRLHDNAALYHALKSGNPVIPIFIFDKNILNELEDRSDKRVQFIYQNIQKMKSDLQKINSDIKIFYDTPQQVFEKLISEFNIEKVFTNHDYEPYAAKRDEEIKSLLSTHNISFQTCKDQVIFEKNEVLKDDGTPYTVFTPYSKKWKATLTDFQLKSYPTEKYFSNFGNLNFGELISEKEMNFSFQPFTFPSSIFPQKIISNYHNTRDFPAIEGISKLSLHLRFGTISIRELMRYAKTTNEKYWNELIWREFYMMILWHFPYVANSCFKPAYNFIKWRNNETEFDTWCNGKTGYPIVDAGMNELNETGFMHNRVRMIVASFLTKHLLVDWRWGEAYFAKKLLDFELSSNNGGWQWAAGCGVDAAPYFRVFNPALQTERFDKDFKYINKWLPDLNSFHYPKPIVDHKFARNRVLKVYADCLKKESL